jgi:excisionase family DNA binding protein
MIPLVHSEREAALLLGVSHTTVKKLLARGDLPYVKIGARTLIARATLESFLEDREQRRGGCEHGGLRRAPGVGGHAENLLAGADALARFPGG